MVLETGKKVYFLSDFHLGAPNDTESRKREDRLVRFLQDARKDAGIIFIVGDIFDFWFEYKTVVPKGFAFSCIFLRVIMICGCKIIYQKN